MSSVSNFKLPFLLRLKMRLFGFRSTEISENTMILQVPRLLINDPRRARQMDRMLDEWVEQLALVGKRAEIARVGQLVRIRLLRDDAEAAYVDRELDQWHGARNRGWSPSA